ncbi:DUF885 domain-containing protein [Dermatobacter hominis]|uniref:DUF885 domain-containing protein n=1 Tax=Dermatobacter hominis TaxID=2884263 RepID=UPI001D104948|nr:DUF885 domain-containing protein [Dermatobacter hominis]UDY36774.1 DUF885 domain-containing protein [Dermatobacter hominis]
MTGDRAVLDVADRYWTTVLAAAPTSATLLGIHDHDDRLEDLSAAADRRLRDELAAMADDLAEATAGEGSSPISPAVAVTADLLAHQLRTGIEAIDLRLVEMASDQMLGPHASLLMAVPQMTYPEPADAQAALTRYAQVPRLLGQALDRFRDGLEAGRTPAAAVVGRSVNSLEQYLATDEDDDPFLQPGLPAGADGEPWDGADAWRQDALELVHDVIRPAFRAYLGVLREELVPVARDDDHAGWCHLDDGEAMYAALVRAHTTLDRSPEELHELGRERTEQVLPAEYRELGAEVFGTTDLQEIFTRLRTDPDLKHRDADDIIEVATSTVARATAAIDDWFGRLPESPCTVLPVPDFLAADAPYAYYYPPAVDGSRGGTYFINTADPTEASRTEAESIAFHEAIPGHHLQIAISQELDDLPEFQRHDGATSYIEGWGLYAERLADEMGLYSGPLDRLGMLTADSWRSARLVVDTGLHALGWTRQQAVDYFEAHTPVPIDQVLAEVDRYLAMPGQALSYKVGQLHIQALRDEARARLGEGFRIADFHDVVLGSGAVTLPVLTRLVEGWAEAGGGRNRAVAG